MKRAILLLLTASLALALCAAPASAVPDVSAKSAIVINADTGEVVYEKDADAQMKIASTTKILTALVALNNARPDDVVTIKREWTGVEGSSIYLKPGEKLTVRDLLYGLLLESGNDAAVAVACHVAGDIASFAQKMNDTAARLGCANSHFVNPHGLDAQGHLSTARDLAIITRAAMENETFRTIVGTKSVTAGGRQMRNHNKLLWDYNGTLGVKTGYTKSAGRSLVSCAERGGMRFICVTLSDPDDWRDHASLYDAAFAAYERAEIRKDGGVYVTVPVISGMKKTVELQPDRDYSFVIPRGGELLLTPEIPQFLYAATVRGAKYGTLIVTSGGVEIARIPLLCKETVMRDEGEKLTAWEKFKRAWYYANEHAGYRGMYVY